MPLRRTLLRGYYGKKNIGDDVFLVVTDWAITKIFDSPGVNVYGNNLPELKHITKHGFSKHRFIPFLQVRTAILRSECILHVGGSIFNKAVKRIADERRLFFFKKCYALGISIGPFKDQESYNYIKKYLNTFKYVSVRDNQSMQYSQEMGLSCHVSKAFDVAAILPLIDEDLQYLPENIQVQKDCSKSVIGVSVCNYEKYQGKNIQNETLRLNNLVRVIRTVIKGNSNLEFRFFIFNENKNNGDLPVTEDVINMLKDEINVSIVRYTADTLAFWRQVKLCNLFVGFRLHSAILSYMAKVPFILFEYHPKCTDFLDDIGYNHEFRVDSLMSLIDSDLQTKLSSLLKDDSIQLTTLPSTQATQIAYNDFIRFAEVVKRDELPSYKKQIFNLYQQIFNPVRNLLHIRR